MQIVRVALAIPALSAAALFLIGGALRFFPEPIGSRADLFAAGAKTTLVLTLLAAALGLALGTLAALAKLSRAWPAKRLAEFYVWVFRGTPLVTQILFVYYALPALIPGLRLSEFSGALVALACNVGAYNAEAIRAGILAVPRGQSEAARSLGLKPAQTMRLVILPQALPMMGPPLVNNFVALLKDSAMASSIGLLELTLQGSRVASETYLPLPVFTTVALIYLTLTTVVGLISGLVLRK